MKYIDADRLKAEIDNLESFSCISEEQDGFYSAISRINGIIDSLQQEQLKDIVVIAKTFLDALSKTPYNNKPITDAQIIVKQLLLFFENPKEYNPDAILEQPEVDLEKEINYWYNTMGVPVTAEALRETARHFYELGFNARK